jgi:hypothetical protein
VVILNEEGWIGVVPARLAITMISTILLSQHCHVKVLDDPTNHNTKYGMDCSLAWYAIVHSAIICPQSFDT